MRSRFWERKYGVWLVAVMMCLPFLSAVAQSINGRVVNGSQWLNDDTIFPPHWHVAAAAGSVENTRGRIVVALYDGLGALITLEHLAPADPATQIVLASAFGVSYNYVLGNGLAPGQYIVRAWVDGNQNLIYDVGEPYGERSVTVSGDSSVNGIEVRISDDTDRDLLEDWWEVHWFGDLAQSATSDYDNDGLSNGDEYNLILGGLDIHPNNWDTDGDRMDDGWELFYNFDPTLPGGANDANSDPDNDGLSTLTEYRGADGVGPRKALFGGIAAITGSTDAMHPRRADSDDDGVSDFDEFVHNLTHPVHPMSSTNYFPRSLDLAVTPIGGVALPDPYKARFGFPDEGGTVEFWIYPEGDGDGTIYDFPTAPSSAIRVSLEDYRPKAEILMNGVATATVGGTNDPASGVYGQISQLATGKWSHVAFVWAPQINSIQLYVDGILLIAREGFVYPDLSALSDPVIAAGMSDGYLDELRVWNYPRTASDIEYWHDRLYPAPGYVRRASTRCSGTVAQHYLYGSPLIAYYRFDDAGESVEDFAALNSGLYPVADSYAIAGLPAGAVSAAQGVSLLGSDDADGDGVPEWWNELHKLERYPRYEERKIGPFYEPCPDDPFLIQGFKYFRALTAYASIGGAVAWAEDDTDPASQFYRPKTVLDFLEGHRSTYMRYVYLHTVPRQAEMTLFTPGMSSTILYINGRRITPEGSEGDRRQRYDIAAELNVGRNMVYVRCVSTTDLTYSPGSSQVNATSADYRACDPSIIQFLDCEGSPYKFERALGKFDAQLVCDGRAMIVRGDKSRNDPRAVWHCQFWSRLAEELAITHFPVSDNDGRALPANQDYGAINHGEKYNNPLDPTVADDGLDAFYEYICGTNPRDVDSNNNGIPDGEEDFDGDGLTNLEEQQLGSHPWLPDSDDDGVLDGADSSDIGHPSSSLIPRRNLSIQFDGTPNSYVELAKNRRFALYEWTLESWIKPDADELDGGIVLQRKVTEREVNYELGLLPDKRVYVRYVPNFGLDEVVLASPGPIVGDGQTWTHVAATYFNRELNLYIDGTNAAKRAGLAAGPAVYAGGPIAQRIGAGFKGCIDEVRIWGAERDRLNIANDMDHVLSGLEPHLVGYYRFDDGTSYSNAAGTVIGTSRNNTATGNSNVVAWTWGQVEDYVGAHANDWWEMWRHAGTIVGSGVSFSTNSAVVGPPSLQVYIDRPSDEGFGARWSVNGGATWNKSGALLVNLNDTDYTISFKDVNGWLTPASLLVSLQRGVSTVTNVEYLRPASIRVELNNNQAVITNAAWRLIPDGAWNSIGAAGQVDGLTPGVEYFVDLQTLPPEIGYTKPTNTPFRVVLAEEEERQIVTQYERVRGSVMVFCAPADSAAALNGRWRPSTRTNWYQSGEVVSGLEFGQHVITFNDFAPTRWTAPDDITIGIVNAGQTITTTGTYVRLPQPTSISATIAPPAAIAAGAQWRIELGVWQNSGDVINVTPGTYTVSFRQLDDWLSPNATEVTVAEETQMMVTGAYYSVVILGDTGQGANQLRRPRGVAANLRYVFVADSDNNRIQVIDRFSGFWGAYGDVAGSSSVGQFRQPFGIDLDAQGNLWVADTGNHRVQRLAMASGWQAWGTRGASVGQFNAPYDVALDDDGTLYVSDYHNSRVQRRSVAGVWSIFASSGSVNGLVRYPSGLAVDATKRVYVSDYDPVTLGGFVRLQRFKGDGAWEDTLGSSVLDEGGLGVIHGLASLDTGALLVAETGGDRLLSRANTGAWSVLLEGRVLDQPWDTASDAWGNTVVSDSGNDRVFILPATDTDGDGIPDDVEPDFGTSPLLADTDGDSYSDWREVLAGSDPTDANSIPAYRALDYAGVGVDDLASYDDGWWRVLMVDAAAHWSSPAKWGMPGDWPVAGDLTGDGKADLAVFRRSSGWWFVADSSPADTQQKWGIPGDVPVPGDYDGDGRADFAVFRSSGWWFVRRSSDQVIVRQKWGVVGDVPVPADYDNDGLTDFAIFRPRSGYWIILGSTAGTIRQKWGVPGDVPTPGDFDGDGIVDLAVFRDGWWIIRQSSTLSMVKRKWGIVGDAPVNGDYDGDKRDDLSVFRAANRTRYISLSGGGTWVVREATDTALPVHGQYWINRSFGLVP